MTSLFTHSTRASFAPSLHTSDPLGPACGCSKTAYFVPTAQQFLYSLRHAHEFEEKPAHFKNALLDRLYTRAEFANFTSMEYDQYLARFMGKNDRYAQLAYAEEQGEARGITIGEARGITIG
ncbi:MAG: hypothetical protein LBU89_03665, partial [Fibromonadaceae bacterium]|nr:hypothetical protein [Fibromonadaceae bacterium]